jgi:hypothetical protein
VLVNKNLPPTAAACVLHAPKLILIAFLTVSSLSGFTAYASAPASTLREKDLNRGESIIAKLRELERLTAESASSEKHRKLVAKMYPGLFVQVADLRAGDLKTDLTTAVFLYDEVLQSQIDSNNHTLDCIDEPREVYAKLCFESKTGRLQDFLKAKARLHTRWAEAVINYHRGINDVVTMATLELIRRERDNDLTLARQAVESLQTLEKNVCNYSSLAEFEEKRALARVPFEKLSEDASETLQSIDRVLLSLPRSPLFYPLYHARNSYANGLFWWRKTYRQGKMVVNVNNLAEPDEMKSSRLNAGEVNYTIAINWRNAIRHAREAANIIEALNASYASHALLKKM